MCGMRVGTFTPFSVPLASFLNRCGYAANANFSSCFTLASDMPPPLAMAAISLYYLCIIYKEVWLEIRSCIKIPAARKHNGGFVRRETTYLVRLGSTRLGLSRSADYTLGPISSKNYMLLSARWR